MEPAGSIRHLRIGRIGGRVPLAVLTCPGRSARLLCRELKVNLAYRWFCGLSIEDKIPDHSAF
jgi:hypothetical protein